LAGADKEKREKTSEGEREGKKKDSEERGREGGPLSP